MSAAVRSATAAYLERCEVLAEALEGELGRVAGEIAALEVDIAAHGRFTAAGREIRPAVSLLARFVGHRIDAISRLHRRVVCGRGRNPTLSPPDVAVVGFRSPGPSGPAPATGPAGRRTGRASPA